MFCFNYNHSYVKNYENDKYSNFKQLAEAYLLARALGDMSPSALFRGCKGKEASNMFSNIFLFSNIFTGQEAVLWLFVGQSPQTEYSLLCI